MTTYLEIESEEGTEFEADVILSTYHAHELVSVRNAAGVCIMHKLSAAERKAIINECEYKYEQAEARALRAVRNDGLSW